MAQELLKKNEWFTKDPEIAYKAIFNKHSILDRLLELDYQNIPENDFPHSEHHIETVHNYITCIGMHLKLDQDDITLLQQAAIYHDIGNAFVGIKGIGVEEHTDVSAMVAYMATGNLDLATIVLNHDRDLTNVLRNAPDNKLNLFIKILRDADQLAWMGYSGLVRFLYYKGYRTDGMRGEIESQGHLFDSRCTTEGTPIDVDLNILEIFNNEIIYFLYDNRLVSEAIIHCLQNIDRCIGKSDFLKNVEALAYSDKLLLNYRATGTPPLIRRNLIEPISSVYSHLFISKILREVELLETLKRIDNPPLSDTICS